MIFTPYVGPLTILAFVALGFTMPCTMPYEPEPEYAGFIFTEVDFIDLRSRRSAGTSPANTVLLYRRRPLSRHLRSSTSCVVAVPTSERFRDVASTMRGNGNL